jgi:hypothetical protein
MIKDNYWYEGQYDCKSTYRPPRESRGPQMWALMWKSTNQLLRSPIVPRDPSLWCSGNCSYNRREVIRSTCVRRCPPQNKQFCGCSRRPKSRHKNSRQATSAVTSRGETVDGWSASNQGTPGKRGARQALGESARIRCFPAELAESGAKRETRDGSSFSPSCVRAGRQRGAEMQANSDSARAECHVYVGAPSKETHVPAAFQPDRTKTFSWRRRK